MEEDSLKAGKEPGVRNSDGITRVQKGRRFSVFAEIRRQGIGESCYCVGWTTRIMPGRRMATFPLFRFRAATVVLYVVAIE
jgi:hypothetical protein